LRGFPSGYDDLRVTAFSPRTVAGAPTLAGFGGGTYPVESWSFANNGTERGLTAVTQWPHSLIRNTPIYVHVHMAATNAVAAGVVLGFFVSLRLALKGSEAPWEGIYWCSHTVPVGGYGAKHHVYTDDVAIDLTEVGPSGIVLINVFRIKGTVVATTNAGNVTENVNDVLWLHELDFHVKTTGNGSPSNVFNWT
jgi:hypothetical protein